MRGLERGEAPGGADRSGSAGPPTSTAPPGAAGHPGEQGDGGGGLGARVRRGLGLSLANTLLSRVGTFAMGIALARLLAPDEFGAYAAALVVQNLLLAVNDLGAAAAVVRQPGSGRGAV
ncbi:oligosaccharide flippase family protein, partial [Actinoalloteichus spitiensis]|uniref:oligosaccharide flippase family protein n=1 Tax=Actinoalloteichus spitiensis TaxID=252394 RepID=UPI0012F6C8EB